MTRGYWERWADLAEELEDERDELRAENEMLRATVVDLMRAYQAAAAHGAYKGALCAYANHLVAERFPEVRYG